MLGNGLGISSEKEQSNPFGQVAPPGASSFRKKQYMRNYADRINPQDIEEIRKLIIRFFVANNIAFSIVESESFIALIQKLRPAFVAANGLPARRSISGPYLNILYGDVTMKIDAYFKEFLDSGGKITLVLDG